MFERFFERAMYACRWILAPVYIGLAMALIALLLKFFQKGITLLLTIFEKSEADLILVVLSMIDLALVGGLIVMVMFSGYENFVSKIDLGEGEDRLAWLGKMGSTSLKTKVAASIVAISSIHLLKIFMAVETTDNEKIMWYMILHMAFVVSAIGMAYLDYRTTKDH